MAMVINSNISSLNAQNRLGASQSSLATSMQRLSSGLRINSAKDDAAGLAISERMSAQVRGLNQASRNANDGVSLMQTAEGALGTIGNNLQRIRELAVQARNATNSDDDRAALQKEVAQLKSEIDRVSETTAFNGTKLLDGSFTAKSFQVGANYGERIDVEKIVDAKTSELGSAAFAVGSTVAAGTAASAAAAGAAATTSPGFASAQVNFTWGEGTDTQTASFTLDSVSAKAITADTANPAFGEAEAKLANETAVTARLNEFKAKIEEVTGGRASVNVEKDKVTLSSSTDGFKMTGGAAIGLATNVEATKGFKDLSVATTAGADEAIVRVDAALKAVNSARADLGAMQNRFESVVSNLGVNSENLSASKSRILDADFAQETANLSRAQILQQAGTAMIAQANQLPQQVLSLLR